jgi:hypothetical protein
VDSLKKLRASKGARNAFRSLDYNILDMQRVEFLPLTFNGDILFELPLVDKSTLHFHAKLMHEMDKRQNTWTKTITLYIKNDMNLMFRTSTCASHLRCENQDCKYTSYIHHTSSMNKME